MIDWTCVVEVEDGKETFGIEEVNGVVTVGAKTC